MSKHWRGVNAVRWLIVWFYTMLASDLALDGVTAGEVVGLLVVGAVCLVFILCAGWINAAPRRDR